MNKKIARKRKKIVSQVRQHRVLPNGRILTADGRETLLGNLAPVKHIPMLPWRKVLVFPTEVRTISVATEGKNAWFYQLLKKYTGRTHDLIGFTPVGALDEEAIAKAGVGSVGIGVQVLEIEPPDENGRANVRLQGICRYENLGFQPSSDDDYFCISVRWIEDNREADAHVKPEFEKCVGIFAEISEILIGAGYEDFKAARGGLRFDWAAAQNLSFAMVEGAQKHFEEDERRELLLTRSTAKRFKMLNGYFKDLLAETEKRFANRKKS